MEPVSSHYRGDSAFAQRRKLNQVTRTVRDLSPKREQSGGGRIRQAVDPRWDPFSGEITSSEKGKAQSVKPKNFGVSLRSENERRARNMDLSTPTPLGERIRKLNSKASFESLEVKSPNYRASSPSSSNYRFERESPELPSIPPKDAELPSIPEKDTALPPVPQKDSALPSVPEKDIASSISQKSASFISKIPTSTAQNNNATETKTRIFATVDPAHKNNHVNYSGGKRDEETSYLRNMAINPPDLTPEQSALIQQLEPPQLSTRKDQSSPPSIIEPSFRKSPAQTSPQISSEIMDKIVQTPRLNSSSINALKDSSPLSRSNDNTLNEPPIKISAQTQNESAVMNRVRPKVMESHFNRINRKAVPLSSPIFISMSNPSVSNAKGRLQNIKALPQTPAENSSHDLVTALQAHLDGLAHRRRNIARSIRQMTELMPRENLLITEEVRLRREREKRHVAKLLEEEAEIKREEHEVGLRLHRAWKRTESGAVYEPTSLWVRRVTG